MIVPSYWAEARLQRWQGKRQVTVRRWGWSDTSELDAQAMAQSRAEQALSDLLAGKPIARRERKLAYNGAEGLPIREEVLARHAETVVTRNAYGAHCLNTPNVLFADVDFSKDPPSSLAWVLFLIGTLITVTLGRPLIGGWSWLLAGVLSTLFSSSLAKLIYRLHIQLKGGHLALTQRKVASFLAEHPQWHVRMYQTPGGMRLLATHQPLEPDAPEVHTFFDAVGADPIYVRMCTNQRCFRARLTGKPWRMDIHSPMRPRPGVWPVRAEAMARRTIWTEDYDRKSQGYAACRWVADSGSGVIHPEVQPVVELHDRLTKACQTGLPLA